VILALALAQLALTAPAPKNAAAPPAKSAPTPRRGAAAAPPPTHVQAATADYDYKRHRTVMTGAPLVTLTREDATLVCRKLTTEDDEAGQIKHAVCEGDVKLTRADREVTCAHATYEASTGKVVCVGDPVLKDGESIIRCVELVYDLDQDKVSLKQPKGTLVQKPGQASPLARGKAKDAAQEKKR
jgi:lipopolysaccharide transport protein LptA